MAFSRTAFALAALVIAGACGDAGPEAAAFEEDATVAGTVVACAGPSK